MTKGDNYTGTGLEGPLEGHLSLCEALDRVLNKGAVICGDVTISVSNVDLIYLSLRLLVTAVETARRQILNKGEICEGKKENCRAGL
ncbi:MAG TPA: gas vesicle protein [Candidatus Hypogeohydataceae bacterium YC38]